MRPEGASSKLFSPLSITVLVMVMFGLLIANVFTLKADRELQSVSIGELRLASWTLSRLGQEANALDKSLALAEVGALDPEEVKLRYDILWSRFTNLLQSSEALPTRSHGDNKIRLAELFDQLKALEPLVLSLIDNNWEGLHELLEQWKPMEGAIEELMIENFVGGPTGMLMDSIDSSRTRMSNLRMVSLFALLLIIVYLTLALVYLKKRARVDPLTGLPNFNYLRERRITDQDTLILAVEIQDYRNIQNDIGPGQAESLTLVFSQRLKECLTSRDLLVVSGRDEFVVIASGRSFAAGEALVARVLEAQEFEWRCENHVFRIKPRLGVDQIASDGTLADIRQRYQNALQAKNRATEEGVSVAYFSDQLQARLDADKAVLLGLVNLFNDVPTLLSMSMVYQPIVATDKSKSIIGAEVLLRGQHNQLGAIAPNHLVALCERNGLGKKLGRWIFKRIAEEAGPLYQHSRYQGTLSINLNPAMMTPSLIGDVKALLIDQGIPGRALCMEITEDNAALHFNQINQLLLELRKLGISSALDDFGTGHSSLEYVRELKVNRLKIDRCFVKDIESDSHKERFLQSILTLVEQLYLDTVIEGVENQAQWEAFSGKPNVSVQGFYVYRPMPFSDYYRLLIEKDRLDVSADVTSRETVNTKVVGCRDCAIWSPSKLSLRR